MSLFAWNGTSARDFSHHGVIFITFKNHFGSKLGDRLTSRNVCFLKNWRNDLKNKIKFCNLLPKHSFNSGSILPFF